MRPKSGTMALHLQNIISLFAIVCPAIRGVALIGLVDAAILVFFALVDW